jgi:hypothetical protein
MGLVDVILFPARFYVINMTLEFLRSSGYLLLRLHTKKMICPSILLNLFKCLDYLAHFMAINIMSRLLPKSFILDSYNDFKLELIWF